MTLVRSKSNPDRWHETTAERCNCPGFTYRQRCRHIEAVKAALQPKPAGRVSKAEFDRIVDEIWGVQ